MPEHIKVRLKACMQTSEAMRGTYHYSGDDNGEADESNESAYQSEQLPVTKKKGGRLPRAKNKSAGTKEPSPKDGGLCKLGQI